MRVTSSRFDRCYAWEPSKYGQVTAWERRLDGHQLYLRRRKKDGCIARVNVSKDRGPGWASRPSHWLGTVWLLGPRGTMVPRENFFGDTRHGVRHMAFMAAVAMLDAARDGYP